MIQNNFKKTHKWHAPLKEDVFDIFSSYKKIGGCSLIIVENQNPPNEDRSLFPNSWFTSKFSNRMKPILEITGLITNQRSEGNGRACLQALYEYSKHLGCGGRMQLVSDFHSASFYEHCGFSGPNLTSDGFKYFDPTSHNLSLLFPKGIQRTEYRFIPVETPVLRKNKLSERDKVLFEQMLQKRNCQKE